MLGQASLLQSIATLEEFFNEYYVTNFEEMPIEADSRIEAIQAKTNYIYNPMDEGLNTRYIATKDGKKMYFIKKAKLPKELRDGIIGGDAGEGTYQDYATLNDVYGITGDLKVYYSKNGISQMIGITKDNLDIDNPYRGIFNATDNSSIYTLLAGFDKKDEDGINDGVLTADELKKVIEVNLDSTSGISSLGDLYNLVNLQTLTLKDISLDSLDGLQFTNSITYLAIENCSIGDYKQIWALEKTLEYLYIDKETQEQVNKILNVIKEKDFNKLAYVGIRFGVDVNDLSLLGSFTQSTKNAIQYLYLNNNQITNIEFLEKFNDLIALNLNTNRITSLKGLKSNLLVDLNVNNNYLGINEKYDITLDTLGKSSDDALYSLRECPNISTLYLQNNKIIWIDYVNYCLCSGGLYLSANSNFAVESIKAINAKYNEQASYRRSIDSNWLKYLGTDSKIDLLGANLNNNSDDFKNLYNNTYVEILRLDGNTTLDKSGYTGHSIGDTLRTCTNLRVLSLENLPNLTSVAFLSSLKKLEYLDLWDCTGITDISVLEEHCPNLKNLYVNTPGLELSGIQTCINRLGGVPAGSFRGDMYDGLVIGGPLLERLEDLDEIEHLNISCRLDTCFGYHCDLSGCTNLKTISIRYTQATFKFPASVTSLYLMLYPVVGRKVSEYKGEFDFSLCTLLPSLSLQGRVDWDISCGLETLNKCAALQTFSFGMLRGGIFDFNWVKDLGSLWSIALSPDSINSFHLEIRNSTSLPSSLRQLSITNFNYVSGLRELGNIVRLTFSNCHLDYLDFCKNNTIIEYLDLDGNAIISLKDLEGCINLTELHLETNLIDDGTQATGINMDILRDLHNNHSLSKVYLEGNNKISDWTSVSEIAGWDDTTKSGW